MNKSEGYLLCVFGNATYFRLCMRLIKNIRKYDTKRPIHILTDNIEFFKDKDLTAQKFNYMNHSYPNINSTTDWNRFGFIPKLHQFSYSPFQRTCYFDVDMIFHSDFTWIWSQLDNAGFPLLLPGVSDDTNMSPLDWHWSTIKTVSIHVGHSLPQISSTAILYTQAVTESLTTAISEIICNLQLVKALSIFRGGYPDEIVFSILLGKHEVRPSKVLFDWFSNKTVCDNCNKKI